MLGNGTATANGQPNRALQGASEADFMRCLKKELEKNVSHQVKLIDAARFQDALFPWFEPTHAPSSVKELEALQSGGVQRLYTGNVRAGEHTLDISLFAKSGNKDDLQSASYKFNKSVEPKLIEVMLAGPGSSSQRIGFKD